MTIPPWVDLSRELLDTADRVVTVPEFVRENAAILRGLGLDDVRAAEGIAHAATESAWGRRGVGSNLGGVKLKQGDDAAYRAKHGCGLAWWRWQGHARSGDPPVVLYRAFADAAEFWCFWLKRYVPQSAGAGDRYAAAGRAFWSNAPARWFVELLRAGYRGEVRQQEIAALTDPEVHPSVRAHRVVVRRVRALMEGP